MKKRDRGLTPTSTILVAGWSEAIRREGMEVKPDTASATKTKMFNQINLINKVNRNTISAKSILVGEGSSGDKDKTIQREIDNAW